MARLDEICLINMGQSPDSSSYNENCDGLPFFQGNADFGQKHPTCRVWCNAPVKIADLGDILISVRAPIGALNVADRKCCIGRGLAALRVINNVCNQEYLWYALETKVNELNSKGIGSTFKAISKSILEETEIPLPPIEDQVHFAAVLNKVSELISIRKKQLDKLDELVKSRFVEMFGDPKTNENGYVVKKLGELANKISDGVHAKPTYTESGRPFLSVVNINRGVINFNGCKFVSEEAYQKMIKSTHPEYGDVLYTKVGATYGIPAFVDTDIEFCLYVSVCLIKPKHELINSKFLALSMALPYVKSQADSRIKGIGVPDLHLNQISEFNIVCPPCKDQEEYVNFVERVDKVKLSINQSLEKLETLKKALMQKYFE